MIVVFERERVHARVDTQTLADSDCLPTCFHLSCRLLLVLVLRQFLLNVVLEVVLIVVSCLEEVFFRLLGLGLLVQLVGILLVVVWHLEPVSFFLMHIVEQRLGFVYLLLHALASAHLSQIPSQRRHPRSLNFLWARGFVKRVALAGHKRFN